MAMRSTSIHLPVITVILMVILGGCRSDSLRLLGETQPDDLQIIDVHTHASPHGGFERIGDSFPTREQYFEELRKNNVVGAVAHGGEVDENSAEDFNDLRMRNVVYCGGVGEKVDVKKIREGLKSGKYGCIKIYLGYVARYAYDKAYEPLYRLAKKYDVPVVFHTGDTYSTDGKLKYADPLTIDEVAVDHPEVRFVIAHCGNPWIESAAEVAYKNPNVYLDGSALLIGNLDEMSRDKVNEYVVKPIAWIFGYLEDPSKLMYGSDWPITDMAPYITAFKRAIPREHWKSVFHDNALKVFKTLQ